VTDVIIVMSQYSKSSHSGTKTQINCHCGIFYKHTLSYKNIVFKISSFGLELWEKKHLAGQHSDQNSALFMTSACRPPSALQRAA